MFTKRVRRRHQKLFIKTDDLRKCHYFLRYIEHYFNLEVEAIDIPQMNAREFCVYLNSLLANELGYSSEHVDLDQIKNWMVSAFNENIISEGHFAWLKTNERACFWFWVILRCSVFELSDDQKLNISNLVLPKCNSSFVPLVPQPKPPINPRVQEMLDLLKDGRQKNPEDIKNQSKALEKIELNSVPEYIRVGLNEHPHNSQERYDLIVKFFDLWRTPVPFFPYSPDDTPFRTHLFNRDSMHTSYLGSPQTFIANDQRRPQNEAVNELPVISFSSKLEFLKKMEQYWYNSYAKKDGFTWLDRKDAKQCDWAWQYLLNQKKENENSLPFIDLFQPFGTHDKYLAIYGVFDTWDTSWNQKEFYLDKMLKAWGQKKYRDNIKKEATRVQLKKQTLKKLELIAKLHEKKSSDIIEKLINEEYKKQEWPL